MSYSPTLDARPARVSAPAIRKISNADVFVALRRGVADFWDNPTHYAFLCVVYPVIGVVLAFWSAQANLLPLLYPLASGFALLGPFAAVGLYEISRRRELQQSGDWDDGLRILKSPRIGSISMLALMLLALFMAWLIVAEWLYTGLMGSNPPQSLSSLLSQILGTQRGWLLILLGNGIGLLFALLVLATTVVSFPMLVDRDVTVPEAIETSIAAVRTNPGPMLLWGLIVAALLAIGTLPIFIGLIIVLPILGHSTWHLYRTVVEPPASASLE